jgi:hypothetical protein
MTTTSIGVQELRTRIGAKAKAEPQHRFWGLYTHVWKLDVLREAYRLAKENNGAPGVDRVTFAQVEATGVEKVLEALSQEMREKVYEPLPCRHVNRRFASRQRPKRRGGRSWTTWSTKEIYETWGLFRDYGVAWCSESRGKTT